ncbi:MAG: hypothetical protein L3J59_05070 [Methylococcaceae bacterium]|nr:hypothetical protein [Methylococcaceae bacterium]
MISEDPRKKNRRRAERRAKERRVITYAFGSPEWINAIQKDYLLWPKEDRRGKDRRNNSRRQGKRRTKNAAIPESTNTSQMYSLLTTEEKQMLNELSQSNKDNL